MRTRNYSVMILKQPLNKWNPENRATERDPIIRAANGDLMTTKLCQILQNHKECVAISNTLVLELLQEYRKKSRRLKLAKKRIKDIEGHCSTLNLEKGFFTGYISELESENERLKTRIKRLTKKKKNSRS